MTPIVELRRATKDFRGIAAFSDVDFALERGEIHALLGENGAGKSTLTKIIAGVYPLSAGTLLIDGKEESLRRLRKASQRALPWSTRKTASFRR
jgi:ABC-type sugar transport system ATPase subunit